MDLHDSQDFARNAGAPEPEAPAFQAISVDSSAHDHGGHDMHHGPMEHAAHGQHAGHGDHAAHGDHGAHGDHIGQFRRLFWINLLIAIPVVAFSGMFAMILGYTVPDWARWIAPIFGTVMYVWGGRPFLTGAVSELKSRKPGMMLLIGLA